MDIFTIYNKNKIWKVQLIIFKKFLFDKIKIYHSFWSK